MWGLTIDTHDIDRLFNIEVISVDFFTSGRHHNSKTFSFEHITQGLYNITGDIISVETDVKPIAIKLSVDTKEDFDLINELIGSDKMDAFLPKLEDIFFKKWKQ